MYITIADSWFAEGRAKGRAEAVLGVLEHRDLPIPGPVRERVLSTNDEPALQRWFHRAFSVSAAHQLFDSTHDPDTPHEITPTPNDP